MLSLSSYRADPTSRKNIRQFTKSIRNILDFNDDPYFPVLEFLEWVMPELHEGFNYEIVDDLEGKYAVTYPEEDLIVLSRRTYDNAEKGIGRDRFTIAHEIGHFFLHRPGNLALYRIDDESNTTDIPAYKDPEWQANTFAGELLAPAELIKGFSVIEVMENCKVSKEVSEIQLKQSRSGVR